MSKLLLSDFWKSMGFKADREEVMGSKARQLVVATYIDKTNMDWDSTFDLNYFGGLSKEILVQTRLNSRDYQPDTWHTLVIEL